MVAIDENISSKEKNTILDDVDSAVELDIVNLMNDSDTEYITEGEIQPEKDAHNRPIITSEANTHVVSTEQPNEEPKKKDKKQKEEFWKWNKTPSTKSRKRYDLALEIMLQFTQKVSPMEIFGEITGLEELIEMILTRSNLYTQQNGRIFEVDIKEKK